MEPILKDLEDLARQAGEILRAGFGQVRDVEYKGVIDPVTEFDRRSEALLVGEIQRLFPSHSILAEESGGLPGEARHLWYIDPLDGTVNFAHGMPYFAVSVAYAESGRLQLGIVYDPVREECFTAQRGVGAWLNDRPISVSGTKELDRSLLATGFPYDIRQNPDNNLDHYARLSLHTQAVRRFGSAALDLCYVAAGRFDGYWEIRTFPWDFAASSLIAVEAGAIVTNLAGDSNLFVPPYSVVAANPHLHPRLLRLLDHSS